MRTSTIVVTRYTQLNHDEPTNAMKETTITSEQHHNNHFQPVVNDVEEKDVLCDLLRKFNDGEEQDEDQEKEDEMITSGYVGKEAMEGSNKSENYNKTDKVDEEVGSEDEASALGVVTGTRSITNTSTNSIKSTISPSTSSLLYSTKITNTVPINTKLSNYRRKKLGIINGLIKIRDELATASKRHKATNNVDQSVTTVRSSINIYPPSSLNNDINQLSSVESTVSVSNNNTSNGNPITENSIKLKMIDTEFQTNDIVDNVESLEKKNFNKTKVTKQSPSSTLVVQSVEDKENLFDSAEQEKEEQQEELEEEDSGQKISSSMYNALIFPTLGDDEDMNKDSYSDTDKDDSILENNPFNAWDKSSDEQEKLIEEMVIHNESALLDTSRTSMVDDQLQPNGRWFILLLAGNSTIVKLRQKDFAKYLKLNLAARLSLEYDEVKVNRVILAPPRLMVNVSVVPSNENGIEDLDEELDMDEKVFGEEEAPLHKLAETNATLLELSGEEYHVVRFLSLRSQQPVMLDDVPSATSMIVNDKHTDIETVIYTAVGGACAIVILATAFIALFKYLRTAHINWPWNRTKPLFNSLPRHQRMGEEPLPSIGGPLTVIYSGNFVDRSGPPSGSWLEDHHTLTANNPPISESIYGTLSNNSLPEQLPGNHCVIPESPRYKLDSKLHILSCRPNHLLLPHQSPRLTNKKNTLDVRIERSGLDNPNYQT